MKKQPLYKLIQPAILEILNDPGVIRVEENINFQQTLRTPYGWKSLSESCFEHFDIHVSSLTVSDIHGRIKGHSPSKATVRKTLYKLFDQGEVLITDRNQLCVDAMAFRSARIINEVVPQIHAREHIKYAEILNQKATEREETNFDKKTNARSTAKRLDRYGVKATINSFSYSLVIDPNQFNSLLGLLDRLSR